MNLDLGYSFRDSALFEAALTHPSLGRRANNQRMEFLGDAVLGMAVAELLYAMYPTENEGELARRHAALVCGETLTQIARTLNLGAFVHMAESEISAGGRENPSNLEDACEALIGAMFLDGGYEAARAFIVRHWEPLARSVKSPPKDAKTGLQEWAQARGLAVPSYTVVQSTGPAHAPMFTIEARIEGYPGVQATAASKRAAEQIAAKQMLESLA